MKHLTVDNPKEELENLVSLIEKHNILYYTDSNPEISDAEYDALLARFHELKKSYPAYAGLYTLSKNVGAPVAKGYRTITHDIPMLSLANAFTEEDVEQFLSRVAKGLKHTATEGLEVMCEPKMDGVSFSARFEKGKLQWGATRGDGKIGEDITANLRTLIDFPNECKNGSFPDIFDVRGEVYINHNDFFAMNEAKSVAGEKLFANPRNAASGSLRRLKGKASENQILRYVCWGIGYASESIALNQKKMLEQLKDFGFCVNPLVELCDSFESMMCYYNNLARNRAMLGYDIDGVVYKVNDFAIQEKLGTISRSPRWAIAHKFASEKAITLIQAITPQVGRTGVITPVAELLPINVGGVLVSRATLHNQEEINRKDIRVLDRVVVQRAGDVIPQIVEVDYTARKKDSIPYIFPTECPICKGPLEQEEGEAAIRCIAGSLCPAQAIEALKHFVSRDAFDIEGLGERQIKSFWEEGRIKNPADIFMLQETDAAQPIPLSEKEGWGQKSANNLFVAIQERRTISLDRFIYALGIRHVGKTTSRHIALYYNDFAHWKKHMDIIASKGEIYDLEAFRELLSIENIGEKVATSLVHFFSYEKHKALIDSLEKLLNITSVTSSYKESFFTGKILVFTGTLTLLNREEAKKKAEAHGAKVVNSLSSKTDYLIMGENAGSKQKKAIQLGIKTLSETEWLQWMEQ